MSAPNPGRRKAFLIFFSVLLIVAAGGVLYWLHSRSFEETDDATIDGHLNPISSRVDGTITKVYVDDNVRVKAGDPLVDLDPRDFQLALDQASAQLAQARTLISTELPNVPITEVESTTSISTAEAQISNAKAAVAAAQKDMDTAKARLAQSEATNAKAQADLARYQLLIAKEEVSQQEFDQVAAAAKAQAAEVNASQSAVAAAAATIRQREAQELEAQSRLSQYRKTAPQALRLRRAAVVSQEAVAKTSETAVELAQLRLSYTKIAAPVDGIVLRRTAEVGAHIAAGQELLEIAQINDLWVTANYKETQIRGMHAGQAAIIHVDALKQDFEGYVDTLGASTGAVASVLPPENATGNFVKVVQRLPIRIRFKPNQDGLERLRPGMSVEPRVRID